MKVGAGKHAFGLLLKILSSAGVYLASSITLGRLFFCMAYGNVAVEQMKGSHDLPRILGGRTRAEEASL
jgi:hypothetical protein